jgi:hypothetical protein
MKFFACVLGLGLLAALPDGRAGILHGPVTNSVNGHVYYLLAPNSWTVSEAEAVQLGGHLATVNDPAESMWLRDTFGAWNAGERALWIGLNDARLEGTFQWASGDPVNFRFWRRSFPAQSDPDADYAFIDFPSSIYEGSWRNTRNDNFDQPGLPICGVVEIAPAGEPVLSLARQGGQTRIDFTGMLQEAPSVHGPWTELTNASSPFWLPSDAKDFTITSLDKPALGFYRSRGPESIFDRSAVVELTLEGPFQVYFEKAFAGMPDGIFPPVREKPWFEGEVALSAPGLERPIDVRVRGNSSLQECPFPKLKFKLSREDRAGTPFFNAREIKVGTHCAEGGRGTIGRLRDERATWREALVYEIMAALDFTSPRVRRAQIQYHDTSPTNGVRDVGWTLSRKALLLDDIEVVAERLGGRALDDEEITTLTNANFSAQLIADLRVLHAFVGNWDYALSTDGSNLWNTDVVALPDGGLLPVAGDFDLCSFVTEEVQLNAPWDFHPELADLPRETRWRLEQVRTSVPAETFTASRDRFTAKRPAIDALVSHALIDDAGRTNALQHVSAFYGALEALGGVRAK